uniref:SET domain-containing protein 2 n=2 Tax=Lotharella globosa TaxID=91324 RepID=A0A7S3YIG6_9EUKA
MAYLQEAHKKHIVDERLYNNIIFSCDKQSDLAVRLFRRMNGEQIRQTAATYNSVLACCERAGEWKLCQRIFNGMLEQRVEPDVATYELVIAALGKAKQLPQVLELFEPLKADRRRCTTGIYNIVVHACILAGDLVRALQLVRGMREAQPSILTYNLILAACRQNGRWKDALDTFKMLTADNRITPNLQSYEYLLGSLTPGNVVTTEMHTKVQLWQKAKEAFESMRKHGVQRSSETYNALFWAFADGARFGELTGLFIKMPEDKVQPNQDTYHALLSCAGATGNWMNAVQRFAEMKLMKIPRGTTTYNLLFVSLLSSHQWIEVIKAWDAMISVKVPPDAYSYCAVLDACAALADFKRAKTCFERFYESRRELASSLEKLGTSSASNALITELTMYALGAAMHSCIRGSSWQAADELFGLTWSEDFHPEAEKYSRMLADAGQRGSSHIPQGMKVAQSIKNSSMQRIAICRASTVTNMELMKKKRGRKARIDLAIAAAISSIMPALDGWRTSSSELRVRVQGHARHERVARFSEEPLPEVGVADNFRRGRMRFDKPDDDLELPWSLLSSRGDRKIAVVDVKPFGMLLNRSVVHTVDEDGPAAKGGVVPGDEITHVEGHAVTEDNLTQVFQSEKMPFAIELLPKSANLQGREHSQKAADRRHQHNSDSWTDNKYPIKRSENRERHVRWSQEPTRPEHGVDWEIPPPESKQGRNQHNGRGSKWEEPATGEWQATQERRHPDQIRGQEQPRSDSWGSERYGRMKSDEVQQNAQNSSRESNEPPLPKGWEAVRDEDSGDVYYWNMDTDETTWTRPEPEDAQSTRSQDFQSESGSRGSGTRSPESYEEKMINYLTSQLKKAATDSNPDVALRSLKQLRSLDVNASLLQKTEVLKVLRSTCSSMAEFTEVAIRCGELIRHWRPFTNAGTAGAAREGVTGARRGRGRIH